MNGEMIIAAFVNPGRAAAKFMSAFKRSEIRFDTIFIEVTGFRRTKQPAGSKPDRMRALLLALAKIRFKDLAPKAADYFNELIYRWSKLFRLPPPSFLPPWTVNREHYTPEYYGNFTPDLRLVESFNDESTAGQLRMVKPDLIVLCDLKRIIKEHIIRIPRIGILNAHPGALPRYRGRDAILHALLNGDPPEATVHFIDAGIDSGPVVATAPIPVRRGETIDSLWAAAEDVEAELMVRAVKSIRDGTCRPRPQNEAKSCYNKPVTKRQRREAERKLRELQRNL